MSEPGIGVNADSRGSSLNCLSGAAQTDAGGWSSINFDSRSPIEMGMSRI
jgi:hypothetical protein